MNGLLGQKKVGREEKKVDGLLVLLLYIIITDTILTTREAGKPTATLLNARDEIGTVMTDDNIFLFFFYFLKNGKRPKEKGKPITNYF